MFGSERVVAMNRSHVSDRPVSLYIPCPPTCRPPIWPVARLVPKAIPFEDRYPSPRRSRPFASLSLTGPKT